MTAFDWILLIIAMPWIGFIFYNAVEATKSPLWLLDESPYPARVFIPFAMLLFIAYRLWGEG
jgi:hypothetical protein